MKLKIGVYILFVLFLYNGCQYSRQFAKPDTYCTQLGTIAVLPFDNRTTYPQAGAIATDLFITEMLSKGSFDMVSPAEVNERLGIHHWQEASDILSQHTPQQLGSAIYADTLLIGAVTEYYYKKGLRDSPVVGLDLKIVVADTGETIWAASITREAIPFFFYKGSLNETTQKVCRQLVTDLKNSLK